MSRRVNIVIILILNDRIESNGDGLRAVGLGGGDAGDVGGLTPLGGRRDVVVVVGVDAAQTDAALGPASVLACCEPMTWLTHNQLIANSLNYRRRFVTAR